MAAAGVEDQAAAAMASEKEEAPNTEPAMASHQDEDITAAGGELLYCGTTSWDTVGRSKQADSGNITTPSRLSPLVNVPIAFIATGSASVHCVAIAVDGRCFTWGRNDKGQLGHGDLVTRGAPTVVSALAEHKVIKAGAGKQHTVVVTDDGSSYAFGFNKHGQLGCGHNKDECEQLPVKCLVSDVTYACCGADFTVWLSSVEGASILTAGYPQFGQLGHGTDNEYNMKEGTVKLAYEAQSKPKAIAAFSEKTVTKVACGHNHTVAADSDGFCYTWGNGGYGRLGHKEQKDEWSPRQVEVFQKQNVLPPDAVVAAGAAFSACTAGGGQLYMWGRVKATGDNWMYPKPLSDLNGWSIRSMDSGNTISMVAAETSSISWGTASSGELGYGPKGPKSSANPKKIEALEGFHVMSVACGLAQSMMLVSRAKDGERLEEFEVYECSNEEKAEDEEEDAESESEPEPEQKPGRKRNPPNRRQTPSKRPQRKKAKKKYSSDEDEDEEDEEPEDDTDDDEFDSETEESEEEYMSDESESPRAKRGGAARGRGRGRGRGRPRKS